MDDEAALKETQLRWGSGAWTDNETSEFRHLVGCVSDHGEEFIIGNGGNWEEACADADHKDKLRMPILSMTKDENARLRS